MQPGTESKPCGKWDKLLRERETVALSATERDLALDVLRGYYEVGLYGHGDELFEILRSVRNDDTRLAALLYRIGSLLARGSLEEAVALLQTAKALSTPSVSLKATRACFDSVIYRPDQKNVRIDNVDTKFLSGAVQFLTRNRLGEDLRQSIVKR